VRSEADGAGELWSEPAWEGRRLADRYDLGAEIGVGAMGVVHRATDLRMDREVAVKLMIRSALGARAWFAREAKVAASVTHPGVVRILDYGEVEGVPFLVSELLEGESLDERLRGGGVGVRRVLEIGAAVAAAMAHCHAGGLVHRDLKPSNVFLDRRSGVERVVVLDFGLAFLRNADSGELGRITGDGVVCGTPAYMSPEQCQGAEIGTAADVYALGCLLFEGVTGRLLFEGGSHELLASHAFAQPPRVRDVDAGSDPQVDALVAAMVGKQPSQRPTMAQLVPALLAAAAREQRGTVAPSAVRDSAPTLASRGISAAEAPRGGSATIAVIGAVEDSVLLALGAAGYRAVRSVDVGDAELVLVASPSEAALRALVASPAWVVVMTPMVTEFTVISHLLEVGVRDVIAMPHRPEDIVRKMSRLLLRKRRSL
jgi:eukaryotic-like serine/threonine-protein kinase